MKNIANAASQGETELLIKSTRSKKEESSRKSLKEKKEEVEADFCEKETMAPPPLLMTMPPTMPLPKMVLGKSSEQERTVLGKKIEAASLASLKTESLSDR